jgi:hypothetical protein
MAPRDSLTSSVPFSINRGMHLAAWVVGLMFLLAASFNMCEMLDADKIMVIQSPVSGKLTWHVSAGIKYQGFGKVTKYQKRDIYEFEIPVRFNDGGHGTIVGSIQYEMPLDAENLTELHTKFGSQRAVESALIQTVTNKAVYMTGPLMSSRESFAEKRNYLIRYVEDQIANGVYRTTSKEVKVIDQMTGQEKTATVVEIVQDAGVPVRQEEAVLQEFGIRTFNFAILRLPYDVAVENQIKAQQSLAMDVQTAIAAAKKAEQNAITAEKNGEAEAMKSKWEQEVIKARVVTEAEQQRDVAKLNMEAAGFQKQKLILEGEGEAAKKRLVFSANGALEQKLEAWVAVNQAYAAALKDFKGPMVPSVVMSGDGRGSGVNASNVMDLIGVKMARDLGLDMEIKQ